MKVLMRLTPVGFPIKWQYLRDWDFTKEARGYVVLTPDADRAYRFDSVEVAMALWKAQSPIAPLRPDGLPNRPLTAYHATFDTVEA